MQMDLHTNKIKLQSYWTHLWMILAGNNLFGKVATRLAVITAPPYHERKNIAKFNPRGFISPSAKIYHSDLQIGRHVFIDDRSLIYQHMGMGKIRIADRVIIQHDVILETGREGSITLEDNASIAFGSHLSSYASPIIIRRDARIAANCTFHAQDHGDNRKAHWELKTKGPITVEYGAWIGANSIILSGVTIGREAAVAAGSVVTRDVPPGTIAAGNPARIIKKRGE